MEDVDTSPALLGALSSEQFMLQSIAGSTISEAGTRSMIYLSALSGGLVAIGFASSTKGLLAPLAFTVLPTIFLLGWFTIVRLVDTTIESVTATRRIEAIRAYYARLTPTAHSFFAAEDPMSNGKFGVRYSRWSVVFAMASMIGLVNAVLAGSITALALTITAHASVVVATAAGVGVGVLLFAATVIYERVRVGALFPRAAHRRAGVAVSASTAGEVRQLS